MMTAWYGFDKVSQGRGWSIILVIAIRTYTICCSSIIDMCFTLLSMAGSYASVA